jgi:6-pyruvoyltetrahydropterin/6-carboxytetrahydropterin synthase
MLTNKKILYVEEYCLYCNQKFNKLLYSNIKFCSDKCYYKSHNNKSIFNYIRKKYKYSCMLCNKKSNLLIHYINNDKNDIDESNLILICEDCYKNIKNSKLLATVYKSFNIEIAHHLPNHETCGTIHGHSIKIIIGVKGQINLKTGMVIDFKEIKKYIQKIIIDKFDHSYLNDTFLIPTAEIFAYYIFLKLKEAGLNITIVKIYETNDNYVEYTNS